jgi:hypothetical protein
MGQSLTKRKREGGKGEEGEGERRMNLASPRTRTHWPGAYLRIVCDGEVGGEGEVWVVEGEGVGL